MSTATKTQTQNERDQVIEAWDRTKGALAETQWNLQIMQQALVGYQQKYGEFLSVEILNSIVKANAHQLDWLAEPPKPTVKKGDTFQKLAEVGVLKSPRMSMADMEEQRKKADGKKQAQIDLATTFMERASLLAKRQQASTLTIQHPKLGVIDWRRTNEERSKQVAKSEAQIQAFNSKVSDDLKIA